MKTKTKIIWKKPNYLCNMYLVQFPIVPFSYFISEDYITNGYYSPVDSSQLVINVKHFISYTVWNKRNDIKYQTLYFRHSSVSQSVDVILSHQSVVSLLLQSGCILIHLQVALVLGDYNAVIQGGLHSSTFSLLIQCDKHMGASHSYCLIS